MTVTSEQKKQIFKAFNEGKRQIDIAKELNVDKRKVNQYFRDMKHLYYHKSNESYFNVDLYRKTTATI